MDLSVYHTTSLISTLLFVDTSLENWDHHFVEDVQMALVLQYTPLEASMLAALD